jgi:hypothetical protein
MATLKPAPSLGGPPRPRPSEVSLAWGLCRRRTITLGAFFAATGPDFDSISQTFVTKPGAFYDLSFFYQVVEPGSPPNNGFPRDL